ncbi:hypothetical protein Tco_0034401 [Tanacetum coccineum]
MMDPDPSTSLNTLRGESCEQNNQDLTNAQVIEGHLPALKELLKHQNNRDLIKHMLLNLNEEIHDTDDEDREDNGTNGKGKAVIADDNLAGRLKRVDANFIFMNSHKCPELAKHFSYSIPKTVNEMLKRVDDYVRMEEAFRDTELSNGEF